MIVGNPQLGDRVAVEGHLAPDGTRLADVIVLLSRVPENRFAFTGPVGAMGTGQWTIAGRTVVVSQTTHIDAGIHVGDVVNVAGVIRSDGTWLAQDIRLLTPAGLPFEFVGLVQQLGGPAWLISGVTIVVTGTTEIEPGIKVGDVVKVTGQILPGGIWQASEIKLADTERRFELTGVVQSLAPWKVSGIDLTTNEATEIDAGIKIGDRVQASGRILDDGTWLAEEIRLLPADGFRFEFVGKVDSTAPWIVNGITLTTDAHTQIEAGIVVGDRVRVQGRVLPDGALLAEHIALLDQPLGCTDITVIVVSVNGNQVVLSNGQTITLTDDIQLVGHLQSSVTVIIRMCVRADGTIVIVSIIVIVTPTPTPAPTPTLGPPATPASGGGKVTICHYPGGNKAKGHTLSVGQSAVAAHLAHGDKLGPCN